jgi:hypothetical protein
LWSLSVFCYSQSNVTGQKPGNNASLRCTHSIDSNDSEMLWPYNSRYEQRNTAFETRGVVPSKKQNRQQIIPDIFEKYNKIVETRLVYNLMYKSAVSTPQVTPISYSASFNNSVHIAPALHNQRWGARRQASHEPSSLVSVTGSQK